MDKFFKHKNTLICYNYGIIYDMDFISRVFNSLKNIVATDKGQGVLGIDIGSSSIKVVQLKKKKERAILDTYGEIALGPYGEADIGRAVRAPQAKVIEALSDVIREANVKAKRAAVSIPLKSSFVTIINVPDVGDKNISEVIKIEARRYIPVPISEVVLDWWIFPESRSGQAKAQSPVQEGDKKLIRALLVAIHKDTISMQKEVVTGAGIEVGSFELESFSMMRSSLGRETEPVAVIDFGASTTKVAIVDFGIMKSSHTISKGSQELTLALSNSLNINFKRAEEMKREIGLSPLPEHKEMVSVFEPILDYIFSEANSVIKDYQRKNAQTVTRTIITGGGALLKGLIDFSVKKMGMEVGLADPFSKTEYPAFLEGALKEAGPNFSIALGLALRELQ